MNETLTGVFYSLRGLLAQAELAGGSGNLDEKIRLLDAAQALIDTNRLNGSVGIQTMVHGGSEVFRLGGNNGFGLSYVVGPEGVRLE